MESPSNGEGGQDTASHSAAECMGDDDVALGVRREDANPNERPQVLCLSLRCVQITGGRRIQRSKHTRVPPWRTWRPPAPGPHHEDSLAPPTTFWGLGGTSTVRSGPQPHPSEPRSPDENRSHSHEISWGDRFSFCDVRGITPSETHIAVGATGLEPAAHPPRNPASTRPYDGLTDARSACWGLGGTGEMVVNLSPQHWRFISNQITWTDEG